MDPTPSNPEASARPLPVLRAMIDALDHEVLHLWARRNALVAEIAEYKRRHAVPIRDPVREREILRDRSERAVTLGLAPQLVEGLFRLVLRGSRDRQAALKAELPPDVEQKSVAVIGGRGAMGGFLARLFADLGHAVMVADLETPLTPEEAAAAADVVVISVPIDRTVEVIRRLGPLVREDALLMDVTSLKGPAMDAMLTCSHASVVGTHPLFGPTVHSVQGQRVVVCPGRGEEWLRWLTQMFHARGLVIKEATPEEHDRAMAVVQVLVHFSTEVMGRTLTALGVDVQETLAFTSPVYLMELLMTARHFAQSSDLYASIEMDNPEAARITETFVESAGALRDIIVTRDREAFRTAFEQVRETFGDFTSQALEQSSYLIDRLVEQG
ncbi:MAG: bifunctional chorismate mutase/prephenate dehydrogenase [Planctomycetota bacterium]|nr:MAG: bifunctional chorismate mutase/prephenate dehydrogenase [Planctomycetota bacterium]